MNSALGITTFGFLQIFAYLPLMVPSSDFIICQMFPPTWPAILARSCALGLSVSAVFCLLPVWWWMCAVMGDGLYITPPPRSTPSCARPVLYACF